MITWRCNSSWGRWSIRWLRAALSPLFVEPNCTKEVWFHHFSRNLWLQSDLRTKKTPWKNNATIISDQHVYMRNKSWKCKIKTGIYKHGMVTTQEHKFLLWRLRNGKWKNKFLSDTNNWVEKGHCDFNLSQFKMNVWDLPEFTPLRSSVTTRSGLDCTSPCPISPNNILSYKKTWQVRTTSKWFFFLKFTGANFVHILYSK